MNIAVSLKSIEHFRIWSLRYIYLRETNIHTTLSIQETVNSNLQYKVHIKISDDLLTSPHPNWKLVVPKLSSILLKQCIEEIVSVFTL